MIEFKGTPGPWFWTEKNGQAVALMAAGGKWVADPQCDLSDYGLSGFHWTDVSKDDAALIAAAPDLLAACLSAIPKNLAPDNPNIPDDQVIPLDFTMGELRRIAAAISKALGSAAY